MIPATVTHDDMLKAVEPLLTLLGTDAMSVYAEPIVIVGSSAEPGNDNGYIEFTVPETVEVDPKAVKQPVTVGNDPEWVEKGTKVRVEVIL